MKRPEKKLLVLITSNFPYGGYEIFIKHELPYLAAKFSDVIIAVRDKTDQQISVSLPPNTIVTPIRQIESNIIIRLINIIISNISPIISSWFWDELTNLIRYDANQLSSKIKTLYNTSKASIREKMLLSRIIKPLQNKYHSIVLYSYWATSPAIASSLISSKTKNCFSVARTHGVDLYKERHNPPYLPLRPFLKDHLDIICPISENGKNYLMSQYGFKQNKIRVSKLGVIGGRTSSSKEYKSNLIHIVSCSRIIPLKRVPLLAKGVKLFANNNPTISIKWTHFGSGNKEIEKQIEKIVEEYPKNASYACRGWTNNETIFTEYEKGIFDIFINVSTTEGIPVSIMEAFSFGIPCIATDVGGVSELVNNNNGKLLNRNTSPKNIADAIKELLPLNIRKVKSENARRTFEMGYSAKNNYSSFSSFLTAIRN